MSEQQRRSTAYILVLYFSRHEITEEHVYALKDSIGENIKIIQIKQRISSIEEIYKRVIEYEADEVVAVLPKWMYVQYLSYHSVGGNELPKPIRIVTKKNSKGELTFENFERIVAFDLVTQKL